MSNQDQQPKHHQLETWIDLAGRSSHHHTSTRITQSLTPMERWGSESAANQSWNAVASFKMISDWKESLSGQGTSSMKGQNGSVHEEKKSEGG
jgi:hypothetical protein